MTAWAIRVGWTVSMTGPLNSAELPAVTKFRHRSFAKTLRRSVHNHAPDALALVHQVESLVDLREPHGVGDHRVDLDFAVHVPVDDFRHVGATARASEGGALPDAPGDQLERAGCDLRARRGDADDDALAPTAMASLQRLAHDRDTAGAVEGVVGATNLVRPALRHVDEVCNQVAAGLFGIDEMRHAEPLAPLLLGVVDVDPDDHVGAGEPQALDDVEADAAKPEHDGLGTGVHLSGVEHGADAGGDTAANVADLVEGGVLANFGDGDLGQHREIRKRGRAHVMVHNLAIER